MSAKTKVAYEKANKAGGKGIAVNPKTGVVTLKKGLKAGTYKVQVKITAPAGENYKAASPKTITLTVKSGHCETLVRAGASLSSFRAHRLPLGDRGACERPIEIVAKLLFLQFAFAE